MKKIISFVTAICFLFAISINTVYAQGFVNYRIPNISRYDSLEDVINAAASLIQPLFLLTFGAMLLVGAFTLLTSQGDEEKVASSRKTITAAIIGFIIAVIAPTIVNLLLNILGVDGLNTL